MAIAGVTDDSAELRARISIARSVLGHAPLYRAVQEALAALEGASLADIAASRDLPERCPEEGSREYLRGWHDGHDAGYAVARERLGADSTTV
jgi:hypothetical protein